MKITKKQIRYLHAMCGYPISSDLERWFPKVIREKDTEMEKCSNIRDGNWFTIDRGFEYGIPPLFFYCKEYSCFKGFMANGNWIDQLYLEIPGYNLYICRIPYEKYVKKALIKEAKIRGYHKENTVIKHILYGSEHTVNLSLSINKDKKFSFLGTQQLLFNETTIYKDGVWAEIINITF